MSVYTVVNEAELKTFLSDYDLGSLVDFKGISAGITNTNYFVNTTQGSYVLTIFEQNDFEELPYFLNVMAFMAEHQVPTAHPKPTKSASYLKELKGKPAALVDKLSGHDVEIPTLKQCEVMAEQLAKFHLAGKDFEDFRAPDRGLDWMQQTYQTIQTLLPEDEQNLIETELSYQADICWKALPTGVVHADLFCDNVLFDGDELSGIIDLYYACNAAFLYDVAVMVNDWCRLPDMSYDETKITAILEHYQMIRPFTDLEKQAWPAALRLAALRFFLSRLNDKHLPKEGEMTQIKDPNVFKAVLTYHQLHAQPIQN